MYHLLMWIIASLVFVDIFIGVLNIAKLSHLEEYLHYEQLHRRQAWLDENRKIMEDEQKKNTSRKAT